MDEFFDLPGTVAELFPDYETEESKEADERYDALWEQLKEKLDRAILSELDSVTMLRLINWKSQGMAIGMAIALRMIGMNKEEVANRVKPWFGPGIANGKAT